MVGDGIAGYGCPSMSPIAAGLVHMELNRGGTVADVVVVWARDTADKQVKAG